MNKEVNVVGLRVEGGRRRFYALLMLSALSTMVGGCLFIRLLAANGWGLLDFPLLASFLVLFSWIGIAFWTATFGFLIRLFGRPRPVLRRRAGPLPPTAVIMPIYNEDPVRVFAGVAAMRESLEETPEKPAFDFFVLSDTTDPDIWVREEVAWASSRQSVSGSGGLYYRHRTKNIERKAGNIRDFCERWGRRYVYMIVLDADSLMTGDTMVEMVRRMEEDGQVGVLQVPSALVNRQSLFGRLLQFSSALYGTVFRYGFAFWSGTEGNYWGHNAIIRLEAFVQCCGLPKMPGRPPWGGEILSHDFVEAALMLRAGWKVVSAPDIGGSYEECPANVLDYAKRDERWSQGNLQHLPLVVARGMNLVSRFHMGMGAMSYLASPLWALFLVLSVAEGLAASGAGMRAPHSAGVENALWTLALLPLSGALTLLLLMKGWAYVAAALQPGVVRQFGGRGKLALGVLMETTLSILLAPVLMAFHTTFVVNTLLGRKVNWEAQPREEAGITPAQAFRAHRVHTALGLLGALVLMWQSWTLFFWMLPIVTGLLLSMPLARLTADVSLGRRLLRRRILLSPEESDPPAIVVRQQSHRERLAQQAARAPDAFIQLVVDPVLLELHVAMLPKTNPSARQSDFREGMVWLALWDSIRHTTPEQRLRLMQDPEALGAIHREAWQNWPVTVLQKLVAVPRPRIADQENAPT